MPAAQAGRLRRRADAEGRDQAWCVDGLRGPLVRPAVDDPRDRGDDPRQFGVLARLDPMGPASRRQIPRPAARFAGVRRLYRAAGIWLECGRTRCGHAAISRCTRDRQVSSDRGQIWRLSLHAVRRRQLPSPAIALPVRVAVPRQRQRQCRCHPHQGCAAMGSGDAGGPARQRCIAGADAVVDRRTHGQDQYACRLRRRVSPHRYGSRRHAAADRRSDPDGDDAGERLAVDRDGRAPCRAHPRCGGHRASRRQLPHRGVRARSLCAVRPAIHRCGVAGPPRGRSDAVAAAQAGS